MDQAPVLIAVMGVSGSGKSTIAKALALQFALSFYEADDFHSEKSKQWMASGKPLTDEMREPWIKQLCDTLTNEYTSNKHCILSFSGLKKKHRERFRAIGFHTLFIYLSGSKTLILERMKRRKNHFMPSSLIDSQFDSMEEPNTEKDIVKIDISGTIEDIRKIAHLHVSTMLALPSKKH